MCVPLILSEKDLAPLLHNAAAMDDLSQLIQASMAAYNSGRVAGQVRLETSLLDTRKKYRVTTSAVPGEGQGMRVSALFRGAKDAYFIVLFDGESGDLLALVAGRDLNVWRTGAPAGVACKYYGSQRSRCAWDSSAAADRRMDSCWRSAARFPL